MQATQRDFAAIAGRAAKQCGIFFFCGPDEAGASAAAQTIIDLLENPGERIELSGSDVKNDPALLGDEARSGSLFSGRRYIYVRANGEEAHDALKALIEIDDIEVSTVSPILVVATAATEKSRTAKLLAGREDALVAMFWPPDLNSVSSAVRRMAEAVGLKLNGDLGERIARGSNLDVRVAQSEITKIAIYVDASPHSPVALSTEDLEAIGVKNEEDSFASVVNAVLKGETTKLDQELRRIREHGMNPVGLLLSLERRVTQLIQINSKLGPRGSIESLDRGAKARLGIFWRDERDIRDQLKIWRLQKLERLSAKLTKLHGDLLKNSKAAQLLLTQALTEITHFARRR